MSRLILILNLVIAVFSLSVVIVSMKWLHDEENAEERLSRRYGRSCFIRPVIRTKYSYRTDRSPKINFGGMTRREMNRAIHSAQKYDLLYSSMRKKIKENRKCRIW